MLTRHQVCGIVTAWDGSLYPLWTQPLSPAGREGAFTLRVVVTVPGVPWLVCGAALGYGAASGVSGNDLPTKAHPQGTLRRQHAAGGIDGGPERTARNADRPRSN